MLKKQTKKKNRPGIKEARPQDHDGFTGALLKLHLDGTELAMDDTDHTFNLFG